MGLTERAIEPASFAELPMAAVPNLPENKLFIQQGTLVLKLAETSEDIEAVQALRYRVFYKELSATGGGHKAQMGLDVDPFDAVCDHLMVIDQSRKGEGPIGGDGKKQGAVIGTYRLINRDVAESLGGFYTADEYDISPLLALPGRILELGRSCVEAPYRNRPTLQLLWRGIGAYVLRHDIALMFGCASFQGADPALHRDSLAYLHKNHLAPEYCRPRALPHRFQPMESADTDSMNIRRAFAALPPLLKGYLRLGGVVGDGAVIDSAFDTVDVCIIVRTQLMTGRYLRHFIGEPSESAEA